MTNGTELVISMKLKWSRFTEIKLQKIFLVFVGHLKRDFKIFRSGLVRVYQRFQFDWGEKNLLIFININSKFTKY